MFIIIIILVERRPRLDIDSPLSRFTKQTGPAPFALYSGVTLLTGVTRVAGLVKCHGPPTPEGLAPRK